MLLFEGLNIKWKEVLVMPRSFLGEFLDGVPTRDPSNSVRKSEFEVGDILEFFRMEKAG